MGRLIEASLAHNVICWFFVCQRCSADDWPIIAYTQVRHFNGFHDMSGIVLRMIHRNVPLSQWETFVDGSDGKGFSSAGKNPGKTAGIIYSQMSHEATVRLLAKEYESLPEQVKVEFRELCNSGNGSGNVRKNVQKLNTLLGGKLISSKQEIVFNERVETIDGVSYRRKKVNPAVAGAIRKYALKP